MRIKENLTRNVIAIKKGSSLREGFSADEAILQRSLPAYALRLLRRSFSQ